MKPVKLVIAGLHSFRESQEIRFGDLSDTGVFGIFGPTGSGKSTILDAITLALYGTVGRAEHNTRGILNHGEKSLTVSFEFEIGAHPRRQYKVERMYRRKDELSVQNVRSRLVEMLPEGDVVLADKDSDVTAGVKDVLGLEPEDFTRAVVLPQGKFAEFLNLKGAERNKMLQRLFSLESYGDKLQQRLKTQLDAAAHEQDVVAAQQLGLGDASAEAVEAVKQALELVKLDEAAATTALASARKAFESIKDVWEKHKQLAELEEKLQMYARQAEQVALWERALDADNRARHVLPFMKAAKEAEGSRKSAERAFADTESAAAQLREQHQAEKVRLLQAKRNLEEQRVILGPKQASLQEAVQWEHERKATAAELVELQKQLTTVAEKEDSEQQKLTVLEADAAQCEQRRLDLDGQIRRNTASPDERQQMTLWMQLYNEYLALHREVKASVDVLEKQTAVLQAARRNWQEEQKKLSVLEQQLQHVERDMEQHEALPHDVVEDLLQREQELQRLTIYRGQLQTAETQKASALTALTTWQQTFQQRQADCETKTAEREAGAATVRVLEEQREALQQRMTSSLLASRLTAGEPCPVCGSASHPFPAEPEEHLTEAIADINVQLQQARQRLEALDQALREASDLRAEADAEVRNASSLLQSSEAACLKAQRDIVAVRHDAPADSHQALSLWLREESLRIHNQLEAAKHWTDKRNDLLARLQAIQADINEQKIVLATVATEGKGLSGEVSRLEERKREAEVRLETSLEQVRQAMQTSGQDSIDVQGWAKWMQSQSQRMLDADAFVEKAKAELDQVDKQLAELRTEIDACKARLMACKMDAVKLGAEVGRRADRNAALEAAIRERAGEQSPEEALQEVVSTLNRLEEHVGAAEAAYQAVDEQLRKAEQDAAAAAARLEQAQAGWQRAEAVLIEKLLEYRFVTREEAEEALLDGSEREEWSRVVTEHRTQIARLQALREPLLQQLEGHALDESAWMEAEEQVRAADLQWKEAVSAVGAAQEMFAALSGRHEEWKRLEARRVECESLVSRLTTLKQVLSGNRFVEYVAEEHLEFVARHASDRLKQLTRNRYALELSADGRFVMRDDFNGGVRRPVSTLSGGETFLTSLSLALSLSTQIQLQGKYPLEFFFLDEGFGTLDADLLDVVMSTLEKLHMENMTIGIISHVPELRQRLQRRLIVEPAEPAGRGTRVAVERA